MTNATINNFFGGNLEEEVMDEVVILPVDIRNTGTGTITLPVGMEWQDFEYIDIALGIATNTQAYDMSTISGKFLKSNPSAWSVRLQLNDGTSYGLVVSASGANTASWSSFGGSNYPRYMIGQKRRIARVGLDELMSSMGMPNLVTNPDLNNPVNQRSFNGNWGSLAIGAYGYDQWIKVSNTHMGFVVESGKYIPNKMHTLTVNNAVVKQIMSPASGHFVVSIPFATSGVYDFYAGEFKRPWQPPQDSFTKCARYYEKGKARTVGDGAVSYSTANTRIIRKRETATPVVITRDATGAAGKCSFDSTNGINAAANVVDNNNLECTVSNVVASTNSFIHFYWSVDSSIPWADLSRNVIIAL